MQSQGLDAQARSTSPTSRATTPAPQFIKHFKEVQRLQTQLDQYTDLTAEQEADDREPSCPRTTCSAFRGVYLETAQRLKEQQDKARRRRPTAAVEQLDFEFVLFASAVIDYDYIMKLIARLHRPGRRASRR